MLISQAGRLFRLPPGLQDDGATGSQAAQHGSQQPHGAVPGTAEGERVASALSPCGRADAVDSRTSSVSGGRQRWRREQVHHGSGALQEPRFGSAASAL